MNESQANALATALGGETHQSGGDIWLVIIRRPDGSLVVFSDNLVAEYPDEDAFDAAQPTKTITLHADPTEYWVVQDEEGAVFLADPDHARGWPDEYEAEHEASALQSRTGLKHWARPQKLEDTLPAALDS